MDGFLGTFIYMRVFLFLFFFSPVLAGSFKANMPTNLPNYMQSFPLGFQVFFFFFFLPSSNTGEIWLIARSSFEYKLGLIT